jgi:hypothetical protein
MTTSRSQMAWAATQCRRPAPMPAGRARGRSARPPSHRRHAAGRRTPAAVARDRCRTGRGEIAEPSGSAGDQGGPMFGRCLIASRAPLPFAGSFVLLNRRSWKRSSPSSALTLSVSLPPKLRVTPTETEHMPIYLRTFFRVLSSLVHRCGRVTAAVERPVARGSRSGSPRRIELEGARPRDSVKPLPLRPDHVEFPVRAPVAHEGHPPPVR